MADVIINFEYHAVLLVGRSGNGITSCCRTINSRPIDRGHNLILTALECPIITEDEDDDISQLAVLRHVKSKLNECLHYGGTSAIALVMKYGVRFTKQEKDAVTMVKSIMGNDVMKHFGMIIMTYGDNFDPDDNDSSFMDWCHHQTGEIATLFKEINYRIVLFDNKSKDTTKNDRQIDSLLHNVLMIDRKFQLADLKPSFPETPVPIDDHISHVSDSHSLIGGHCYSDNNHRHSWRWVYEKIIQPLYYIWRYLHDSMRSWINNTL